MHKLSFRDISKIAKYLDEVSLAYHTRPSHMSTILWFIENEILENNDSFFYIIHYIFYYIINPSFPVYISIDRLKNYILNHSIDHFFDEEILKLVEDNCFLTTKSKNIFLDSLQKSKIEKKRRFRV